MRVGTDHGAGLDARLVENGSGADGDVVGCHREVAGYVELVAAAHDHAVEAGDSGLADVAEAVVGFGLGSDGDESMCYRFNLRGNPFPMISGRTTAPLPPGRQPIMQNCNLQGIRATLPRRRPRVPLSL